jgi:hypothetical protein
LGKNNNEKSKPHNIVYKLVGLPSTEITICHVMDIYDAYSWDFNKVM